MKKIDRVSTDNCESKMDRGSSSDEHPHHCFEFSSLEIKFSYRAGLAIASDAPSDGTDNTAGIGPRHYEYSNCILLFSQNRDDSRLSSIIAIDILPHTISTVFACRHLTTPVHSLVEMNHRHR